MEVTVEPIPNPWSWYRWFVKVDGQVRFMTLTREAAEMAAKEMV